jgi:hypothetical protein
VFPIALRYAIFRRIDLTMKESTLPGKQYCMFLLIIFLFSNFWFFDLKRFTQPDLIGTIPGNSLARNSVPYAPGKPVQYNDPAGHEPCWNDSEPRLAMCSTNEGYDLQTPMLTSEAYITLLEETFGWTVAGDWTAEELQVIYATGNDILRYVDGHTGGSGLAWMLEYFGGLSINHLNRPERGESYPNTGIPFLPRAGIIFLGPGWENPSMGWDPKQLFAHELGHIWDCRSGGLLIFGCAGGRADQLMAYIGAEPGRIRVLSPIYIPKEYEWPWRVHSGYGNGSSFEYVAEAFSWNIYDPTNLPQFELGLWINNEIATQASCLP